MLLTLLANNNLNPPQTHGVVPPLVENRPQEIGVDWRAAGYAIVFAVAAAATVVATVPSTVYAAPQQDLTQQAQVFKPAPGYQGTTVKPLQGGPLPQDLTLAAVITPAAPGYAGTTVRPLQGGPQADPTQLPAVLSAPLSAGPGKLGAQIVSAPQPDPSQLAAVLAQPLVRSTGQLGAFILSAPQPDPSQLPAVLTPSTQAAGSTIGSQYTYGTHAVALAQAEAIKVWVWGPARAPSVTVTFMPVTVQVPPQADPTQLAVVLFRPLSAGPGELGTQIVAAPQADPTQIAPIIWPAQPAPTVTTFPLVVQLFSAPQQFDFTLQAVIQHSAPGYQGRTIPPLPTVQPQQWDFTLQALITPSAFARPGVTVAPLPTVQPQPDLSPNPSAIWTFVPLSHAGTVPVVTPLHQVNMGVTFGTGLTRMGTGK